MWTKDKKSLSKVANDTDGECVSMRAAGGDGKNHTGTAGDDHKRRTGDSNKKEKGRSDEYRRGE